MKILIPVLGFAHYGGFRVLSKLANEWIKAGNHVDFLCLSSSAKPYFPTQANILWIDHKARFVETNSGIDSTSKLKVLKNIRTLRRGISKIGNSYDVVMANLSFTAFAVYYAKCTAKKYYYIQAYEPEYYENSSGIKGWVAHFLSKKSYSLKLERIVNSTIYFSYKNLRADKCIYPGLDLATFHPKQHISSHTPIRIGCIYREEEHKGIKYVIEAFGKLSSKNAGAATLHLAFAPLSMSNSYTVVHTPNGDHELADFYRYIDILVAPGTVQHGAVHYPVIEAMSCQTAVITTGYYPANNANSWIVPIKDADAIVAAIQDIVDKPEAAQKKIQLAYEAIKQFDWPIVAQQLYGYFNS